MQISITPEMSSGVSENKVLKVQEMIRQVLKKVKEEKRDIHWIIYNPTMPEEDFDDKRSQRLNISNNLKQNIMIRNKWGYSKPGVNTIYISTYAINLVETRCISSISAMKKGNGGITGLGNGKIDSPANLQEVILHELAHIISGKGDNDMGFQGELERLKSLAEKTD